MKEEGSMGEKNSTETRVTPFMRKLDGNIKEIKRFLKSLPGIKEEDLDFQSIEAIHYGSNEKALQANYDLLMWLVKHPDWMDSSKLKPSNMSADTYQKRISLFKGDAQTTKKALLYLTKAKDNHATTNRKWYAFEGPSYPDIYIETDKSVFIGEAKRTEPKLTTNTTWLQHRDQLIRHFDSVLSKGKRVKIFYVFEKSDFDKNSTQAQLDRYEDDGYIKESAPHRGKDFPTEFRKAYAGHVYWEDLANEFSIAFE